MAQELGTFTRGTIVVTGGSRGIGKAVGLLAAERAYDVVIHYRNDASAANQVKAEIEDKGQRALCIQGDVSCEADVVHLFNEAESQFSNVIAVVNNAGIVAPSAPLAEVSAERLREVFNVNIYGAYLVAREAARRLPTNRGGKGGAIVNISSIASRLGSPNEYIDYAGSKGAVDTMTVGLAKELALGNVRVNAVRPGLIDTELHASGGAPDRAQRLGKTTPIGRPGTAYEVATAVLWLLSDEASYTTGALLDVGGGR